MHSRRLITCAVLLLIIAQSAFAGRIKGAKSNAVAPGRRLKKNKIKGPEKRSCKVSAKHDEVKFECKSRTGGTARSKGKESKSSSSDGGEEVESRGITVSPEDIKDKIKYNVKTTNDGIRVQIEYKQEVEEEEVETKTETEFKVLFESLVEYVKGDPEDESEAYDWNQDTIVQTVKLNNWADIPGIVDDDEGVVSYFTASTAPSVLSGGSTSFNFTVSRADKDQHITANSMKIDVKILDFPWARSDSYIALMSTVESKKKVKVEYDDQATASKGGKSKKTEDVTVSFAEGMESSLGFTAFGEYTWDEEAEATTTEDDSSYNGTIAVGRQGSDMEDTKSTIQVVATSPSSSGDDTFQGIAYSFVGDGAQSASEIYWDPQAGIGYESAASRQMSFVGLTVTMLCAFTYTVW